MNSELEYNLAGGLALTLFESDFLRFQEKLAESGYRYACFLPFRAIASEGGVSELRKSPLKIVHLEEAWNPTSEDNLFKAVIAGALGNYRRLRGDKSQPPILQDALFPGKSTCERVFQELLHTFPEVKFISHKIDISFPEDRLLVEINPGINLPPEEILAKAEEKGIGLVFDPRHLLLPEETISLPNRPTDQKGGQWEKQLSTFKRRIKVVDINPPSFGDVKDLLAGKGMLRELALAAREVGVEFLRVEIPIPLAKQIPFIPSNQGFELLKEIGLALES